MYGSGPSCHINTYISFRALSVCYVLVLISDEVRVLTALPL